MAAADPPSDADAGEAPVKKEEPGDSAVKAEPVKTETPVKAEATETPVKAELREEPGLEEATRPEGSEVSAANTDLAKSEVKSEVKGEAADKNKVRDSRAWKGMLDSLQGKWFSNDGAVIQVDRSKVIRNGTEMEAQLTPARMLSGTPPEKRLTVMLFEWVVLRDESHTTKLAWQNKRTLGKVYWQRDKAFPKTPMTKGTKRAASDAGLSSAETVKRVTRQATAEASPKAEDGVKTELDALAEVAEGDWTASDGCAIQVQGGVVRRAGRVTKTPVSVRDGKLWWGKWWLDDSIDAVHGTTLVWKTTGSSPVSWVRRVQEPDYAEPTLQPDSTNSYWVVAWREAGEAKQKEFSVLKEGFGRAAEIANDFKKELLTRLQPHLRRAKDEKDVPGSKASPVKSEPA
jgi:hypothetical protein